jgi:hypothetical protein
MAHTRRPRHRDRDPGRRQFEDEGDDVPASSRVFRLTGATREKIAVSLRYIDEARRALESQHNASNRDIVRELRASADEIFELIRDLPEIDE